MKRIALVLVLMVALAGCGSSGGSGPSFDRAGVERVLTAYVSLFQQKQAERLAELYHPPVHWPNSDTYASRQDIINSLNALFRMFDVIEVAAIGRTHIAGSGSTASATIEVLLTVVQGGVGANPIIDYEFGFEKISGEWKVRSERLISIR